MNESEHDRLVDALRDPDLYAHGARDVRVVRTHISSVVCTGPYVYKLKRPVDFGFLDFTRLTDRKHYCEEELRLNRRLAPGMYLDVVPIYGSADAPRLSGGGPVLEYAVQMVQLPAWRTDWAAAPGADARLAHLARMIAEFHAALPAAPPDGPYGTPEAVTQPALDNFRTLARLLTGAEAERAAALASWTRARCAAHQGRYAERLRTGHVRECHGDLHLGNVALVHGAPRVFDCIEFNPGLRWIDVMSELAFLLMDLVTQDQHAHAVRVLNTYLDASGDHAGLALLDDYLAYRALVRAKVAALSQRMADVAPYLALAERVAQDAGRGALVLTCGVSGAGKSHVSAQLLAPLGAVRLRSDVERRRLYPAAEAGRLHAGRYSPEATEHTYAHLATQAAALAQAGYIALVDATFLERERRAAFRARTAALGVPCVVLHVHAAPDTLRARVQARALRRDDPSEADLRVLESQLAHARPPGADEAVVHVDTERALSIDNVMHALRTHGITPHRYLAAPRG